MRRTVLVVSALVLLPCSVAAGAQETDPAELPRLREQIAGLQERVEALERAGSGNPVAKAAAAQGSAHSLTEGKVAKGRGSEIDLREAFNDRQEGAPRPHDLTLDPSYRGFIPIPHTRAMIRFNAKPRVDMSVDSTYSGNDNRFVTSQIPVCGEPQKGGGTQFNLNGQGSQLSVDVRAPGTSGEPRFYFENDFSASGSAYLSFKARHLYGQFYNLVVGQTYTVFEDPDAWPDTVDYEGPNAAISARRPLIRFMLQLEREWAINLAVEKSDSQVDVTGHQTATSENHLPDAGLNIKWARKGLGHVQLGAIFRELGVSEDTHGDQQTLGWGLNLSANFDFLAGDSFQTQITYGHGIYYFMNDAVENHDAAFDAAGELVALPVLAVMAGYTSAWSKRFRSTLSFGFVDLENAHSQAWKACHRTYYASANLVFQLYQRLSFGLEALYGHKQVKSGARGDAFRGQLTAMYSLF